MLVTLPLLYGRDYAERFSVPIFEQRARTITLDATAEQIEDMLADATHYASDGADLAPQWLRKSASAALPDLREIVESF